MKKAHERNYDRQQTVLLKSKRSMPFCSWAANLLILQKSLCVKDTKQPGCGSSKKSIVAKTRPESLFSFTDCHKGASVGPHGSQDEQVSSVQNEQKDRV
jgi:hypothetical protein